MTPTTLKVGIWSRGATTAADQGSSEKSPHIFWAITHLFQVVLNAPRPPKSNHKNIFKLQMQKCFGCMSGAFCVLKYIYNCKNKMIEPNSSPDRLSFIGVSYLLA